MLTEMSQKMVRAYWTARSQKCKQENGQNASHGLMIALFESCGGYPGAHRYTWSWCELEKPTTLLLLLNRPE